MRCWLLVFALAACSHASTGPAWPKSTAVAADGGESLAPRPSAHELASPESADEVAVAPSPTAPAKAAPAATSEAAPAVTTPTEEPITTEEITIEIDEE
jgi:hypothetical protein